MSLLHYFFAAPFNNMQTVVNEQQHFPLSLIILAVSKQKFQLHRLKSPCLGL